MRGLLYKTVRETWLTTLFIGLAMLLFEVLLNVILPQLQEQASEFMLSVPFIRMMLSTILGIEIGDQFTLQMLQAFLWIHPVILAGIAQHRLVWIHPFMDGNGRSARMFTTMLLYQRKYDFKYLFDLSTYYNEDRDEYYRALRTADATGDYTEWLLYFLGGFSREMVRIKLKVIEEAT